MKKKINRILIYKIVLYSLSMLLIATWVIGKKTVLAEYLEANGKKVVLIDPGHGGYDGGASSKNGLQEKSVNLSISLKIKDKLKRSGYEVVMTRDTDKSLYEGDKKFNTKKAEDMYKRCEMKIDTKCDLFISIHQNIFSESKYYGAQVWYSKDNNSKKLAHIVQQNLKNELDNSNNRVEKPAGDNYKILRCNNNQPSILIECGFLSNSNEAEKLEKDEYQEKIAASIVSSIEKYFEEGN